MQTRGLAGLGRRVGGWEWEGNPIGLGVVYKYWFYYIQQGEHARVVTRAPQNHTKINVEAWRARLSSKH